MFKHTHSHSKLVKMELSVRIDLKQQLHPELHLCICSTYTFLSSNSRCLSEHFSPPFLARDDYIWKGRRKERDEGRMASKMMLKDTYAHRYKHIKNHIFECSLKQLKDHSALPAESMKLPQHDYSPPQPDPTWTACLISHHSLI